MVRSILFHECWKDNRILLGGVFHSWCAQTKNRIPSKSHFREIEHITSWPLLAMLGQGSHSDWKNWKTWKNGEAFSSQGKVREFWTDWKSQGKVRENHTKYWKIEGISEKIICYFSMIFKWTVYYLLKCIKFLVRKNKTLKKYWKMEKNTGKVREKSGNFVSPEKWEPCRLWMSKNGDDDWNPTINLVNRLWRFSGKATAFSSWPGRVGGWLSVLSTCVPVQ